ncbi:MAG: GGDEF domain-containing protein [Thermoleophilia bacterium]|jgi:diguanylate cyclase (GGDEF)-like protein
MSSFALLDIKTTLMLISIANAIVLVLLLIYDRRRDKEYSLIIFISGLVCMVAGYFLLYLRGNVPFWLSGCVGNIIIYTGYALEMTAFCILCKASSKFVWCFRFIAALGAVAFVVLYVIPSDILPQSRYVILSSIVLSCMFLLGGIMLLCGGWKECLRCAIGIIFVVLGVAFLVRTWSAYMVSFTLHTSAGSQTTAFLLLFISTIASSIGFMVLTKEEADKELIIAATTDALTGALNRRSFFSKSAEILNFAVRRSLVASIIMLDIDHFKRINDTYGHQRGDAVLKSFVETIHHQIRPYDIFARIGGEEFALLILEDSAGANSLAERIRLAIQELIIEPDIRITTSVGIKTFVPKNANDINDAMRESDNALYKAKETGRNRVVNAA